MKFIVNPNTLFLKVFLMLVLGASCSGSKFIERERVNYYKQINQAEVAILEEDYNKACAYFKSAFKSSGFGNSNDYFNALMVGQTIGDSTLTYLASKELASLGMCPGFFRKINDLKLDSLAYSEVLKISNNNSKNSRYRDELEQILNDDQAIRMIPNISKEEVEKMDSLNYQKFLALIKRFGQPTEARIGVRCTENG